MTLKRNLVANYASQGWRALMLLAFLPTYIRYMGMEAYGLIGVYAILQAWLALLDFGLRPMVSREMARFTAGVHTGTSIRDLLRSVESVLLLVAAAVAVGVWAASGWLATHWVEATALPAETVARSFGIMGALCGLRLLENVYTSCLVGLQKQVLEGALGAIIATLRGAGAVGVLAFVSPDINAFFAWQALMSALGVLLLAGGVYRSLPAPVARARLSLPALRNVWSFGSGMLAITFLALLLTQIDKVLLSRLLPLEQFGQYALAGTVASALNLLVGPITTAFYPRFTELVTRNETRALGLAYHQAAQLATVTMGSAAAMLIVFSAPILMLWTGDAALSRTLAPLTSVLVLGTFLNGLMWIPYHMQLAHGWTSLTVRVNAVAVLLLVPALFVVVPRFGAIGAAWLWTGLNTSYLLFSIYFMHRRVLQTEKWRWYAFDVAMPSLCAFAAALACRAAVPEGTGAAGTFAAIAASSAVVTILAALGSTEGRSRLRALLASSQES